MDEKNELINISETDDRREIIKQKLRQYYDGRIVRIVILMIRKLLTRE